MDLDNQLFFKFRWFTGPPVSVTYNAKQDFSLCVTVGTSIEAGSIISFPELQSHQEFHAPVNIFANEAMFQILKTSHKTRQANLKTTGSVKSSY